MDCTPGQRHSLGLKPRATRSAISERARSLNGIFYTYEEAANGRRCPRILPPKSTVARLSRTLELGRHPGACSSYALRGGARASGTGSKPDSSSHRFAGRKGCPKGGLGSILRATTRQEEVDAMGLLLSAVVPTVTAPSSCCDGRDDCFHSSNALLMADMPETRCARRLRTHGGYASSSVSMLPASRSCPNAGIVEQTFCVDQPQSPLGS
jgi:hypothetical protein